MRLLLWEGVGDGFAGMQNITSTIIHPQSMMGLNHSDEWLAFVDLFKDWDQVDFHKEYLPEPLLRRVKAMSIQWFKKGVKTDDEP